MSPQAIKSVRPRFTPPATKMDLVAEAIALLGFLFTIAMIAYSAINLPDRIPTHVGLSGVIDSYGSKWRLILIFSALSVFLYAMPTVVSRYPYYFNYPVIVTEENAARLYTMARSMFRWLKAIMAWMIVVIAWWPLMVLPYNPAQSMNPLLFLVLFVIATTIVMVYWIMRIVKEGESRDTARA